MGVQKVCSRARGPMESQEDYQTTATKILMAGHRIRPLKQYKHKGKQHCAMHEVMDILLAYKSGIIVTQ